MSGFESRLRSGDLASGVVFCDLATALREHPRLVEQYLGTVIPTGDDGTGVDDTSMWSGGSFVYVPPGVATEVPLQALTTGEAGRSERTLLVADEGSQVHYVEGCSAPVYSHGARYSTVAEVVVRSRARVAFTSIQNRSSHAAGRVRREARVDAHGHLEIVDGTIGSTQTTGQCAVYLVGDGATGEVRTVAFAGGGQGHDLSITIVHAAVSTTSRIVSRSVSKDGGGTTRRTHVRIERGATDAQSHIDCGGLIMDGESTSLTVPRVDLGESDAQIIDRSAVARIDADQLFYLLSRGLSEPQAMAMIANGFMEPVVTTFPVEHAVDWNRIVELGIEGSIG